MNNVSQWCLDKRLTVNVDKTKVVWYGSTQKLPRSRGRHFSMGGLPVEVLDNYTYLGLKIDSPLSFEPALKDLNSKVNHRLFRLGKQRDYMSENVCVDVYKSTVLSLFDYASFAHDGANQGSLKKLDRLQLRGMKTCYKGKSFTEEEMYTRSLIPRLPRRRQDLMLTYMYKLSRDESWVDRAVPRPGLRSESKIKLKVPRVRSGGYINSPLYRGSVLWDNLGDWYQLSKDKLTFKSRVATLLDLTKKNPNPKNALPNEEV